MAFFTNQAQLRYGNEITNSNITVGEIQEVLTVTKTAVKETYRQGGTVTYIISIVNAGTAEYTGLTLSDDLGSYAFGATTRTPLDYSAGTIRYYQNGVLQTAPTVEAGPPLTITGVNVPAGGNATIVYETRLNAYAPLQLEAEITNVVTVSGTCVSGITASETVSAVAEPVLSITKSVSPVPVTECGRLTYTFVIQNTGNVPADSTTEVSVTDTFDPVLRNLTVTFNGTAWTAPTNYTYDETTGMFTTVLGEVTVPAATYTQNSETGEWSTNPGVSTLIVTGTI
ncbi:hypothetical protein DXB18_08455 [Clostridium sp. OM02-18AC]|uniref:DUF11 domain-containing protein n=1 Tax=Clostridium sp. OM02-18AC TaxID=2292311 RepID=UPI000E543255|nr:DUF11 domain-containing protein [Clostridium sp. OM02-18AC]RHV65894.1 hypothetical protein DXB18_08455 [Clostridium sp. OM02-18AC]